MGIISQNAGAINTPDFAGQAASAAQQRKIADLLRAQHMKEEMPQGQMVSGHYVRPSWTQYLAPLLKSYDVGATDRAATQAEGQYAGQVAEARKNWQSALPQTIAGQAAVPGVEQDVGPSIEPAVAPQAAIPEQRPTRDQILKHTLAGLSIPGNEAEAKLVGDSLTSGLTRKEDQDYKDIEARRAAVERKAQALELQGQTAAAAAERAAGDRENRLAIANIMAASRAGDRSSVAADKAADKRAAHEEAVAHASSTIDKMDETVARLDKAGGITDPSRSSATNAASWVRNSPLGQTLGTITGTPEQTDRDNLKNMATGLVTDLKNIKNLGASQMNSNVELQLYLSAVGGGKNNYSASTMREVLRNARALLTGGTPPPLSPSAKNEIAPAGTKPPEGLVLPPGATYIGEAP
jgi:hypothetical protein